MPPFFSFCLGVKEFSELSSKIEGTAAPLWFSLHELVSLATCARGLQIAALETVLLIESTLGLFLGLREPEKVQPFFFFYLM